MPQRLSRQFLQVEQRLHGQAKFQPVLCALDSQRVPKLNLHWNTFHADCAQHIPCQFPALGIPCQLDNLIT